MKNPLVSIIILSLNRREETLKCVASMVNQEYALTEVIVLDNGSADGTPDAIAEQFPAVQLLRMPKNYGDWEGRDIALAECRGDLVFCMDDDATANPEMIGLAVKRMLEEPELAVLQVKVVDPVSGEPYQTQLGLDFADREFYRANFLGGAALYRTDVLRKAGGFPHYLLGGAELHLSLRFLDLGYRVLYFGGAEIFHKKSRKSRAAHQRFFLGNKQRMRAVMSHYPGLVRPALEFSVKLFSFSVEAFKNRLLLHWPWDFIRIAWAGIYARRCPWRISEKTVRLADYLACYPVLTREEYEGIDLGRSYFRDVLQSRSKKGRGRGRAAGSELRTRPGDTD